jgi:hypothetical protein
MPRAERQANDQLFVRFGSPDLRASYSLRGYMAKQNQASRLFLGCVMAIIATASVRP